MKLSWRKRRSEKAGTAARVEATAHLRAGVSQWPEVNAVARSLRELRERNHFSEQLQHIFRGDARP